MADRGGASRSPSEAEKHRGLRWSVASEVFGSAYGVLVLGSVLVLFLNELGLPKEQIGLLNGLVFLPGPIALFIAPHLARFGFKRSLIIFYGARKFVAAPEAECVFGLGCEHCLCLRVCGNAPLRFFSGHCRDRLLSLDPGVRSQFGTRAVYGYL